MMITDDMIGRRPKLVCIFLLMKRGSEVIVIVGLDGFMNWNRSRIMIVDILNSHRLILRFRLGLLLHIFCH